MMADLSFYLSLVLSIFYIAHGANTEARKPNYIKKNAFCVSDQQNNYCSDDTYNFYKIVEQIVKSNDKLSGDNKEIGKNSGVCANALKRAMCSKESPLCFEGEDVSGSDTVCEETLANCRYLQKDQCIKYLQPKFKNLTCVGLGKDEKFKGYCPKPSKKMPVSYWLAYKKKSDVLEDPMKYLEQTRKLTGVELVSEDCMEKIKNAACLPFYCSDDEKSIEIPDIQDKCNEVLKCFNKVFEKYGKLSEALKPIKEILTDGCDKVVNALKSSEVKNDALSLSQTQGIALLLITALLVTKFY